MVGSSSKSSVRRMIVILGSGMGQNVKRARLLVLREETLNEIWERWIGATGELLRNELINIQSICLRWSTKEDKFKTFLTCV